MKQLQGLLAFVETARAGSLTAAAGRLELTPAAVSKSVQRLEAQLGVRLFQRSTRRLSLTEEGRHFLDKASTALRSLDEAVADVSRSAAAATGKVRLSVGMAFGRRWVLPALPALIERHPGLSIEVDLDNHPVDLVAQGFDIGIRGGVVADSSLVARRVCALPVVLVASPAYLRQRGVPQSPDELAGHRCVSMRFPTGPLPAWRFRLGRRTLEWTPQAACTVGDPEAVIDLALAHAGIGQAGLQHALPYLRSGRLKMLMPRLHDPGSREVVLRYPHRRYLAPRVRVVVDALLEHFAGSADLHLSPAQAAAFSEAVAAAEPQPARRRRNTSRSGVDAASSKA